MRGSVERSVPGETPDGRPVSRFEIRNGRGLSLEVLDYGATVVSVETPDRKGQLANITLRLASLSDYLERPSWFGSTIGRTCNRIARARFSLDGETFRLEPNDGPHHLHGGRGGFAMALWNGTPFREAGELGVEFRLRSPHGEGGYPGELDATARYALTERDELVITFSATADRPTPVDLTNHCYWNLRGAGSGTIRDHVLELAADHYLPVDHELIPTGEILPVANTPMDFRAPRAIGERLDEAGRNGAGYDHCFVVRGRSGELRFAARVHEPGSGRTMEIQTTQPGMQFYTGNSLDGSASVNHRPRHSGFCLETQHFPDSPNRAQFPTTILRPGQTYRQQTVHRFSVR